MTAQVGYVEGAFRKKRHLIAEDLFGRAVSQEFRHMYTRNTRRIAILVAMTVMGLAAITTVHIYYIKDVQRENHEALRHTTAILVDRLNGRIREMIHTVEGLGAFLTATPSMPDSEAFEHYALSAVLTHPTLRTLQFVDTSRVIVHTFPVEKNESVVGLDLSLLPDRVHLETARRLHRTIISPNPGLLLQGSMGSIIRTPLYRDKKFIGWAQGVYDLENLINGAEKELPPRLLLQLVDFQGKVLLGSTEMPDDAISAAIESGDSTWQLRVAWDQGNPVVDTIMLAIVWGGGLFLLFAVLWTLHTNWQKEVSLRLEVQKRTAELEESERKLRVAMRLARLFYWEDDFIRNRLIFSEDGNKILGIPLDKKSLTWDEFLEFVFPGDRSFVNEIRMDEILNKSNQQILHRVFRTSNGLRYLESVGEVVLDETGKPIRRVGAMQDVTERIQTDQELRTSEAQLSDALKMAHAGHWEYDVAGDTFTFNDNFYRIFKTSVEEVGGYTMSSANYTRKFCHPDDMDMVRTEILAAIETDDPYYSRQVEHRMLYNNGDVGYIVVRLFVVKDSQGNTVKTYGVNQDITERKMVEEQIKKNLEEKEVLLRELYHRTKNNMQVISSMLRLRARYLKNQQITNIFKEIENKIMGMALVHQKLYESEDLSYLNLKEYIVELVRMISQGYPLLSERIKISVSGTDVNVLLDTAMPFGLIINELVTNAIKYAFPDDRKGNIEITLNMSSKRELEVKVSDNGVGIPKNFDVWRDSGLGIQTVINLVDYQLDGSVKFECENGFSCSIVMQNELYEPRV